MAQCGTLLSDRLSDYDDWLNIFFGGILDGDRRLEMPQEIISDQPVPEEFR